MKAILGSVGRDVADAFAYIPYGLAAAVVFLLIMILYNRKKYGRVSFIIKSSLMIIYVVVVGHLTLFSRESGIVDRVDLTFFSLLEESSDYTIQLIENVLLFLPAGILCPWMWKQIAELEAQLPAWIRRESADRDAADADRQRSVSAG